MVIYTLTPCQSYDDPRSIASLMHKRNIVISVESVSAAQFFASSQTHLRTTCQLRSLCNVRHPVQKTVFLMLTSSMWL